MLFTTYTYLYFFLIAFCIRWTVPPLFVSSVLLFFSYLFYLSWNPIYGFLLAGMTLFAFVVGKQLKRHPRKQKDPNAKKWLWLGLIGCLGTLAYFKYLNFLAQPCYAVWSWLTQTQTNKEWKILLPLGISFFTFQMVGYLIDLYRGEKEETSLLHFALYVSFFPQLIAGPIVRAKDFLFQLTTPNENKSRRFLEGMDLLFLGLIKKMIFADNLAVWATPVFNNPNAYTSLEVWIGVLAFSGQIYCDFSGYSDMALGCGKLLGYDLPNNFSWPYLSQNITDFWRRWHITLSHWLRDYLYISLGGNRKGLWHQNWNLMVTMALGGLWHGASWNFVLWGVFHGFLLLLHKIWQQIVSKIKVLSSIQTSPFYRYFAITLTFFLVSFGWILFRTTHLNQANLVWKKMFTFSLADMLNIFSIPSHFWNVFYQKIHALHPLATQAFLYLLALFVLQIIGTFAFLQKQYKRWDDPFTRALFWFVSVLFCFFFAKSSAEFIYFQF